MNTKLKIAAGVVAGLVAGTTLMGAAFAAPRLTAVPATYGYTMMRSFDTSGAFAAPTYQKMLEFMNQYRTASGGFDVARMHADVTGGKVTPPCVTRGTATGSQGSASTSTSSQTARPQIGYRMMGGSAGYGYPMMGGLY